MFEGYHNKGLVAALMGLLIILDQWFGVSIGWLTEEWITSLLAVATPIVVWWTRNQAP